MNREETKKIIKIICDAYPNYHPQDLSSTITTWSFLLEEYEYNKIAIALKTYITTDASGFAPSVGQLIDKLRTITAPSELTELEAWSKVSKALRNGLYGAEDEFNKLPPLVQKTVGSPSNLRQWAQTDAKSIENVIQSNFLRTYRNILKRDEEINKMPYDVKKLMNQGSIQIEQKEGDA